MKRLFLFIAALILAPNLVVSAFCQDPGIMDSLAFGNPDGTPLVVHVDEDIEVPVWLKCDENIAFIHFCLATENQYIPVRGGAFGVGPLSQWMLSGTFPANGSPQAGYTSASLIGIADFSLPTPNYVNTDEEWVRVGTFAMHTTADTNAIGHESSLIAGEDPIQGLTVIFDENWTPIVPAMKFSALLFEPAVTHPPVIESPTNDTLFTVIKDHLFTMNVIAFDEDYDVITIQAEFSLGSHNMIEIESYPGYVGYLFSWIPDTDSDTIVTARFIATDSGQLSDTIEVNFDIKAAPEIIIPSDDSLIVINTHYPYSMQVIAIDEDGDDIVVAANFPFANYEFDLIESYPGYARYLFSWTPPADYDTTIAASFIAADTTLASDTSNVTFRIKPISVNVTSCTTLAGYDARVDVYLHVDGDNSNIGSFDLFFRWDPNIVTADSVKFHSALVGWENVYSVMNPQGPGTLKLVGFANFIHGGVPPLRYGNYKLATIYFMTANDPGFENIDVPLEMPIDNLSYNVVSDSSGYIIYHPDITQGNIKLLSSEDILVGDINLNLYPYESGDAVMFIAYLADPIGNPFNAIQRLASDCNQDRIPATVADLIYMLNIIGGGGLVLGDSQAGGASLMVQKDGNAFILSMPTKSSVGGVLVRIDHQNTAIGGIEPISGSELQYHDNDGILTMVIYRSSRGSSLSGEILRFTVGGDPGNIVIDSYEISDTAGRLLK